MGERQHRRAHLHADPHVRTRSRSNPHPGHPCQRRPHRRTPRRPSRLHTPLGPQATRASADAERDPFASHPGTLPAHRDQPRVPSPALNHIDSQSISAICVVSRAFCSQNRCLLAGSLSHADRTSGTAEALAQLRQFQGPMTYSAGGTAPDLGGARGEMVARPSRRRRAADQGQ